MIELLVVLAVIASLASLLLPAVTRAKAAARRAHCMSNLRQIGIAFSIYANDHSQYPSSFWAFGPGLSQATFSPFDSGPMGAGLGEYEDVHRLFICPAPRAGLYVFNHYGSGGQERVAQRLPLLGLGLWVWGHAPEVMRLVGPRREPEVIAPSDMIAFGDILGAGEDASFAGMGSASERVSIRVASTPQFEFGRHQTGANVAFCDGHVEFGTRHGFDTGLDSVRRRWNTDNEPHAEFWK